MAESIIFTGDLGLTAAFTTTTEVFSSELIRELTSAEALCINLELPFREPGTKMAPYTHPSLYSPVEKAEQLAQLNPSIVNIGTNHCMDGGAAGIVLTERTLNGLGMTCIGAGINEEKARAPRFLDIGGKRFGFLSYCKKGNFTATDRRAGAALLSTENLGSDLPDARERCDFLIVCMHMGMEFSKSVHPMYRELAHSAADLGASCIIGHHPHVIQGIETYRGVPIFYSLGNLLFDNFAGAVTFKGHWEDRHKGILARVAFSSSEVTYDFLPVKYSSKPLYARLAQEEETHAVLNEVKSLSEEISTGTPAVSAEAEAVGAIAKREFATVIALTRIHGFRFLWYLAKDLKLRHFKMILSALFSRRRGR